jgi:hypothetical protein
VDVTTSTRGKEVSMKTKTPTTAEELVTAQAEVARLEALKAALPVAYQQALAANDLHGMRAARQQQVDLADQLAAATVLATRIEIIDLVAQEAATSDPIMLAERAKKVRAVEDDLKAARATAEQLVKDKQDARNEVVRWAAGITARGVKLRNDLLPAARQRLARLLGSQGMEGGV